MISLCLILPASEQANGDAIAIALGHDVAPGNTYSVPLSASGQAPATHYGCRTWATAGFAALIQAAKSGDMTGLSADLAGTANAVRAGSPSTIAALVADVRDTEDAFAHWSDVLSAQGLCLVAAA